MKGSGSAGKKRAKRHAGPASPRPEKRLRREPGGLVRGQSSKDSRSEKHQEAASLYRQALQDDSDDGQGSGRGTAVGKQPAESKLGDGSDASADELSSSEANNADNETGDDAEERVEKESRKQKGDAKAGTASLGAKRTVHVTVVLEHANLELVKRTGSREGQALLSSDDHAALLRKMKRDPNEARPDITHQCLLTLLDSPLNKAGRLTVYIRTNRNVLISVHPQTRIPRTFRRFSGLMVELLQRFKVRGTSGTKPLLQVIRNPVTSHLPVGQRRILCTYNTDNIVDIRDDAKRTLEEVIVKRSSTDIAAADDDLTVEGGDEDVVHVLYVVGAMAHGKVDAEWTDEAICVSEYPLSAATVCSRITYAYECEMGIL